MRPTDEELLQQLKQGDSNAFDAIYMRYAAHVEAFAYCMLKDRSEAEDLAHDLFLKLWESRDSLDGVRSFKSYLFRMTKNALFDLFERKAVRSRYRESSRQMDVGEFLSEDLAGRVDRRDLLLLIDLAVEKMPAQRRKIFRMNRYDGIPQQEIARKLGISQKSVEYHIRMAVNELKKIIQILLLFFI